MPHISNPKSQTREYGTEIADIAAWNIFGLDYFQIVLYNVW